MSPPTIFTYTDKTTITPVPAEYGTTLLLEIDNLIRLAIKHPKILQITLYLKNTLTTLQHISVELTKAKANLTFSKAFISTK